MKEYSEKMQKAHSDEEIIQKASTLEKNSENVHDNKVDITVDMDDEHGTAHTYVVTYTKEGNGNWVPVEVSEISSL
jgi:C4-type Zn-finger protein